MVVFPALVVLVSLACAVVIGRDWLRRRRPDKAAWLVAFTLFAVAAGAEVIGALAGWTPLLARVYYATGAILVVGFLGLGELYLLAPARAARLGPGIGLFLVAVAVALVSGAPVDTGRLAADGWHALERGPALVLFTIAVNSLGTAVVAGGAVASAWQFWRKGIFRNRMLGCLLIALGTLLVASGGTLTRLGRPEYLYVAMATGITIIGLGYLQTRRPDISALVPAAPTPAPLATAAIVATSSPGPVADQRQAVSPPTIGVATNASVGGMVQAGLPVPTVSDSAPAVAFVVDLLTMAPDEVRERCHFWSAAPLDIARFDREQARRVWGVRLELPAAARGQLDALPAATQVQVAELYRDVLQPDPPDAAPADPVRVAPVLLGSVATSTERTGN